MSQRKIDLLIGADLYAQLLEGPIIKGDERTPTAQLTTLGWIISGPSNDKNNDDRREMLTLNCSIDQNLQTLLEKFWSQEEVHPPQKNSLPTIDQQCEGHFGQTHSRDNEGRYTVKLPFKTSVDDLSDSQPSAHRMLSHLQRKFELSPSFLAAYSKFLTEYELLKHMVQVPDETHEPDHAFYLPHHGVVRETSTSTKLRVVFNGSCKVSTGKSLNELLHTGQKLQKDIFDVLLWVRQFKYLFNADIEKMYRQINVHPNDWKFQRILWKQNEKIVKYELTTVTYGLACAPYLALRCVAQLIQDEGEKYPLAIDTMTHGRYVDDIFGGADTVEQAQEKARQVLDLCMAGGFPLRKWNSNETQVLNVIPTSFHTTNPAISIQDDTIRALGLSWKPQSDTLHFQFAEASSGKVTKQFVLSRIAQLFDPLGLLSPIFIRLKIFMQELWAIKLGWDDLLPPHQLQTWDQVAHLLENLDNISIPRWVGAYTEAHLELHGFCDASQLAIAAVIYVRITDNHHNISVTLLCSKTKVAPIKRITIPRLELSSAVLLTKLVARCRQILNLAEVPCYLWTDSSIVNVWINNHPSRWKEFVHNRVCYIQETLPTAQWQHVSGIINPADCATRGISATSLRSHTIWWQGPPWLSKDSSQWPSKTSSNPEPTSALELRPIAKVTVAHVEIQAEVWNLPTNYSSFNRLLRVTSLCQRFIKRLKKSTTSSVSSAITPCELMEAKKYWIRTTQRQQFSHEITTIEQGKNLTNTSTLIRLTPFIDEEGLLRVGGRLNNSLLNSTAKHPYILPKDHHLSWLLIKHAHAQTLHGSTHETLAYIRNQFWIIGGRNPVRSFILKCVTCTRYRHLTAQQRMGQLPAPRVTPSRAFLHTGVDYAGPFSTKTWKGKNARSYKSWIALFVCLSTSAIHLELVTDCSTDSFISAYKRFIGRRGICATLTSDCGTNFKGADKELKKLFSSSSKELQTFASLIANDGTTWKFNPPSAPHFGGKWESGVKSMKYHLRRVMGDSLFTYEEMTTLLIQIESILNSRPLCPLTNDPDDLSVLTPAHFLIGESLTTIPEPSLEHLQASRLSRWQHLSQLTQRFWRHWSHGYLQRHLSIYKWNKASPNLSKGTIVFIMDERYPPAKWALGRITELHPGKDNLVRVATVKTSTSTFKRPIVKLCPLNLD